MAYDGAGSALICVNSQSPPHCPSTSALPICLAMLVFHDFEMMVRGGSLALLALWSWLLVRDHWQALPARLAVAMNFSVACHVIATIPGPSGIGIVIDWLFELGSVTVPALFWLFARAWFNDEKRISWRSWALVPVCMALLVILDSNSLSKNMAFFATAAALRSGGAQAPPLRSG